MSSIDTSHITPLITNFQKTAGGKGGTVTLKLSDGTEHKLTLESVKTRPIHNKVLTAFLRLFDSNSYQYARVGEQELLISKQELQEKIKNLDPKVKKRLDNDLKCAQTFKTAFSQDSLKSTLALVPQVNG